MAKSAIIGRKKSVKKTDIVSVVYDGVGERLLKELRFRRYSAKSIEAYHIQLKHFFLFLAAEKITALRDVTVETLEDYQRRLLDGSYSPWSVRAYLRTLRVFFGYLENEGLIFDNPALRLQTPKLPKPLPTAPSEKAVKKLLAAARTDTPRGVRTRAMLETAYGCGLRLGELLGMDVLSIDFKAQVVKVRGKGKKERAVPLGKHSLFWIRQYLLSARDRLLGGGIDETALWIDRNGRRMKAQAFQKTMQKLCEEAGIERISPHGLRRACATHMLKNGAHPVQLQHLLGHSTLDTLSHYLRLTANDLKKTHEKSRLGR